MKRSVLAAALAAASLFSAGAQAALFEDDEARRAILELRQRVEQQRLATADELRRATDENVTLRRSLLELQNQIEALRSEMARLRGSDETIARDLADVQRRQKDIAQGVEERLRKFEPVTVTVDGREFAADPAEQREFEAALAAFRKGEFAGAQTGFAEFAR
jgi:TolA-binding protein